MGNQTRSVRELEAECAWVREQRVPKEHVHVFLFINPFEAAVRRRRVYIERLGRRWNVEMMGMMCVLSGVVAIMDI